MSDSDIIEKDIRNHYKQHNKEKYWAKDNNLNKYDIIHRISPTNRKCIGVNSKRKRFTWDFNEVSPKDFRYDTRRYFNDIPNVHKLKCRYYNSLTKIKRQRGNYTKYTYKDERTYIDRNTSYKYFNPKIIKKLYYSKLMENI